jgi:hypothetical protein
VSSSLYGKWKTLSAKIKPFVWKWKDSSSEESMLVDWIGLWVASSPMCQHYSRTMWLQRSLKWCIYNYMCMFKNSNGEDKNLEC